MANTEPLMIDSESPAEEELDISIDYDPYTPDGLELTSALAAAAQTPSTFDNPYAIQDFELKTDEARAIISNGGEDQLRLQIADTENSDELDRATQALLLEVQNPNQDILEIQAIADHIENISAARDTNDSLETAAIDRIQEFAISHPEQAAMIELAVRDFERGGSLAGTIRDQLERTVILRREADKAAKEVSDQWITSDIVDFIARMIPGNKLTSVDNLVETSMLGFHGTSGSSGTSLFSAQQHLLNVPREEFDRILPGIIQSIKDESAFIGENRSLILENINQLRSLTLSERDRENFFDFIDFATIAPALRVVPKLTKGMVAHIAGNRELAKIVTVNSVEKELLLAEGKGLADSAVNLDDLMASNMVTTETLVHGGVNLSGASNWILASNQAGIDAVKTLLKSTPRLTEEEAELAFQAGKKEALESYGEAVTDFYKADIQVAKGVTVPQAVMVLGRKDGIGYGSKSSVLKMLEKKGILFEDPNSPVKVASAALKKAKASEAKVTAAVQSKIAKIEKTTKPTSSSNSAAVQKELDKVDVAKAKTAKANLAHEEAINVRTIKQNRKNGPETEVFKAQDQLWYAKVKTNLKESLYVQSMHEEGMSNAVLLNTYLRSPASFMPKILQERAVSSVFSIGAIQKALKPLRDNLTKGVGRQHREEVAAVYTKGNIEQKWYSLSEFYNEFKILHEGRLPTEGQVTSYYTLKDINDFEHIIRNDGLYQPLAADNWVTGKVSAPNGVTVPTGNMKQIESVDDVGRALILDVSNNLILEGRKVGTETIKTRMKSKGLKLYRLGKPTDHKGFPVNHVLVKDGDLSTRALEYWQLPYSQGGHRMHKGKYFTSQLVTGTTQSGKTFVKNPRTHAVGPTKGIMDEHVATLNGAREAFLTAGGHLLRKAKNSKEQAANAKIFARGDQNLIAESDKIIRDAGIEDGLEGYAKLLDEGDIEDAPFQVVFDGELPKGHKETLSKEGVYDLTFAETHSKGYLAETGSLYYGKKGKGLKTPQGNAAELVEPYTAATLAVENASRVASYTSYRVNAVDRWLKTYDSLLPQNSGLSPRERFWSDSKLLKGDQNQLNQAEAIRATIKSQLGQETKLGSSYRTALRNLAVWVEGPKAGGTRTAASTKVLNLMDKDPVSAIKGFSFDLKLGLFDPSQLIIQTQTIFALASLNPTKFPKFMYDGAMMRYAAINQSDEMTAWAAKRSSMDPEEFTSMVKSMRQSGILEVNKEMTLIDHNATSHVGTVGSAVDTARNMGRIPFFEAERLNRIYAWRKGWDDLREGVGEGAVAMSTKEIMSPDGLLKLKTLADKYTFNMTSASAAWWQKGVWSIPTQFLSYQARFLENILPYVGNKQWTPGEKFQLLAGQVLLYGSAGVPTGRYILENMFEATGVEFDPDSTVDQIAYRAAIGGFWDSMVYGITNGEVDIAFSQRAAVGKAVEDFYEKISGGGYETQSFLEVIGGAPFSVVGDVGSDAWDSIKAITVAAGATTVSVTDVLPHVLTNMQANASSLSRLTRAYYVLKYGEWRSSETGKVLSKATPLESVAAMLGFNLRELADGAYTQGMIKDRTEHIKEISKLIGRLQVDAATQWRDGDKDAWRSTMDQITAWMQVFDGRMRSDIAKRVNRTVQSKTAAERYRERYERDFAPRTLPAENVQRNERTEREALRNP
jgi:hypothetical protein